MRQDIRFGSLAALAVAATLGACAGGAGSADQAAFPITPLSRYALQIEPGIDRIALAVHDEGLSPNQSAAVHALAGRYFAARADVLTIEAPSGDDPAANRSTWAVRAALERAGVPSDRLRVAAYNAPDARAPVLAGFETVQAAIPNCAAERGNMAGRMSNQSSMGLGCAITANMAAQIADPRDILGARPMTPADSGRAAVVFGNYRQGLVTSAPQEELVSGRIARAVE